MLTRLIIFLVRIKLKLKLNETFRFANQKSPNDYYFFDKSGLQKMEYVRRDAFYPHGRKLRPANVSLNWLLNEHCRIVRIKKNTFL